MERCWWVSSGDLDQFLERFLKDSLVFLFLHSSLELVG
jgi:hypothetical protein